LRFHNDRNLSKTIATIDSSDALHQQRPNHSSSYLSRRNSNLNVSGGQSAPTDDEGSRRRAAGREEVLGEIRIKQILIDTVQLVGAHVESPVGRAVAFKTALADVDGGAFNGCCLAYCENSRSWLAYRHQPP
jgi:hypothetical protein